jgi:hypothetical protein
MTEIDILGKVAERKKARSLSFGPTERDLVEQQINSLREELEERMKLLDCDYKTFAIRAKADHPAASESLIDLRDAIESLQNIYSEIKRLNAKWIEEDAKVKAFNKGK